MWRWDITETDFHLPIRPFLKTYANWLDSRVAIKSFLIAVVLSAGVSKSTYLPCRRIQNRWPNWVTHLELGVIFNLDRVSVHAGRGKQDREACSILRRSVEQNQN